MVLTAGNLMALSLLRFFQDKQMRFACGSSADLKVIHPSNQIFLECIKRYGCVSGISRDSKAAIQLLKDPSSAQKQGYQPPASSAQPFESIRDDWRVILVFLELYTFVLKVMDDDEFFSASTTSSTRGADDPAVCEIITPPQRRQGALSLPEKPGLYNVL